MTATSNFSSTRDSRSINNADAALSGSAEPAAPASRTCECLTQTLWCHGCGNSVGYMIVVPCIRCTSSMTVTNRTTNGHRFVFYSSEIAASERFYVPGERGIASLALSPRLPSSQPTSSTGLTPPLPNRTPSSVPSSSRLPSTPPARRDSSTSLLDSPSDRQRHNSAASDDGLSQHYSPISLSDSSSFSSLPPLLPVTPSDRDRMRSDSSFNSYEPPLLKAGDNLYWHQLTRSGEIPAVIDDPRARDPHSLDTEATSVDNLGQMESDSGIKARAPSRSRRRPIPIAGR